jgi:hypothetical protein
VFLAAGILVALGLAVCLVPFTRCPQCQFLEEAGLAFAIAPDRCDVCGGDGRTSVFRKWNWKRQQIKPAGPP